MQLLFILNFFTNKYTKKHSVMLNQMHKQNITLQLTYSTQYNFYFK